MIENVNESVVKIEPKIVLDGTVWGDITGDIADQSDLFAEFAKKINVDPTVLPSGTNPDNIKTNGEYIFDGLFLTVSTNGLSIIQILYDYDTAPSIRFSSGDIWGEWDTYALSSVLTTKVDKVTGKQLSTEDYTTAEKNKLAGLFLPAYASIYVDNGNTAQSIPTGATYTKVTAYTTNGQSANCTADAANDKITITQAGVYSVTYTASYTADTNNVTFRGAVFLDGVEQGNIHSGGQMGLQGAMRSTACSGFINVASVPSDIDVRIRHDNGGTVAITHVYANLNIERIG